MNRHAEEAFDLRLRTAIGDFRGTEVRPAFAVRVQPFEIGDAISVSYDAVCRDAREGILPTLRPQGPGRVRCVVATAGLRNSARPRYRRLVWSVPAPASDAQHPQPPIALGASPSTRAPNTPRTRVSPPQPGRSLRRSWPRASA